MTEADLIEKKEEIQKAKNKLAELKGQEKALLTQLEDEFQVTTLQAAKKRMQNFESKAKKLSDKIKTETAKLVKTYFTEED